MDRTTGTVWVIFFSKSQIDSLDHLSLGVRKDTKDGVIAPLPVSIIPFSQLVAMDVAYNGNAGVGSSTG